MASKRIARDVQAVLYRHAADGQDYVHTFGGGREASIQRTPRGETLELETLPARTRVRMVADGRGVRLEHADGKPLSRDFGTKRFLVNPPKRRRARGKNPPMMVYLASNPTRGGSTMATPKRKKHRRSAAQRAATKRMLAANRSKKRRRVRPNPTRGATVATRKRKRRHNAPKAKRRRRNPGALANPSRRKAHRTYRRNPSRGGFPSMGKILGGVIEGVQDGAVIVGGEMASNIIAGFIPAVQRDETKPADAAGLKPETNLSKFLRQLAGSIGVGFLANMLFGERIARVAVAGAVSAPIRGFVRPQLPATGILAGALGGPTYILPGSPMSGGTYVPKRIGVGSWAQPNERALAAWPRPGTIGEHAESFDHVTMG